MTNISTVCDYIIIQLNADGDSDLTTLKLQKLLYYVQAWHLAFYKKPMFDGEFQAWVHGPVNREIYNRFKDSKFLYSSITLQDVEDKNASDNLSKKDKSHVDSVLDAYAKYSPSQLEFMTHREKPWMEARTGVDKLQRSEKVISEETMTKYYKARLKV
jgi:uncharacterized phage-associated protein